MNEIKFNLHTIVCDPNNDGNHRIVARTWPPGENAGDNEDGDLLGGTLSGVVESPAIRKLFEPGGILEVTVKQVSKPSENASAAPSDEPIKIPTEAGASVPTETATTSKKKG